MSLNAQDSVRGSKESVKGGQGAGDAGGGYAGQMKAIMDAREREMQIQAKAQASIHKSAFLFFNGRAGAGNVDTGQGVGLYSHKSFFFFYGREREVQIQASIHKKSLYSEFYIGTTEALTVEIFFLW